MDEFATFAASEDQPGRLPNCLFLVVKSVPHTQTPMFEMSQHYHKQRNAKGTSTYLQINRTNLVAVDGGNDFFCGG